MSQVMDAATALTSLDLQSCMEFTTESLKAVACCTRSSLTLLNISFTSASINSPLLTRLVRNTPSMRAFYCCGRSLPHDAGNNEALQWRQLHTMSIGCQQRSCATVGSSGHSLQVGVGVGVQGLV